jgi:hypothetical protein
MEPVMRLRSLSSVIRTVFSVVLAVAAAPALHAGGMEFSARGGQVLSEGSQIGADLRIPIGPHLHFSPNLEHVFKANYNDTSLNADLQVDVPSSGPIGVWFGIGLGGVFEDGRQPGMQDETKLVTNFISGVGFRSGRVTPYLQAKVARTDETSFSLGFGLRF